MTVEVHCKICDAPHRAAFGDAEEGCTQGVDCDGQVDLLDGIWYLLCAYGSSLDGNLYRFVKPPEETWQNADPVCDACIRVAIDSGALVQVPGNFPLGFQIVNGQPVPA